jgi:hypothetical protein
MILYEDNVCEDDIDDDPDNNEFARGGIVRTLEILNALYLSYVETNNVDQSRGAVILSVDKTIIILSYDEPYSLTDLHTSPEQSLVTQHNCFSPLSLGTARISLSIIYSSICPKTLARSWRT